MAWITTKDGRRVNTEWFEEDERKKYAQIEAAQEAAKKAGEAEKKDTGKYEEAKGLIFGVAKVTGTYVDIDGFSNKPTIKGMLSDLAKAVAKYDKGEAEAIRSMVKDKEVQQLPPRKDEGGSQYILEWEEVPSASRYVDEDGNDTLLSGKDGDEIEYADGKWYVHTRILR